MSPMIMLMPLLAMLCRAQTEHNHFSFLFVPGSPSDSKPCRPCLLTEKLLWLCGWPKLREICKAPGCVCEDCKGQRACGRGGEARSGRSTCIRPS